MTPVQFAALQTIADEPGIDQRRLAARIGFGTSTLGGVVDRQEGRQLLQHGASARDRRVRLLTLTPEGLQLLAQVRPAMLRAQGRILAPLPPAQKAQFMAMLSTLVAANNELSRAPSAARTDG